MAGGSVYDPYDDLKASVTQAANLQATAAREAGELMRSIANENMQFLREQTDVARADLQPFRDAGVKSTTELESLLGLSGQEAQAASVNGILQGAETQAKLNFGVDALDRRAAAGGSRNSGRAVQELFKYGQDLAATQISNQQQRLLQLTQLGQQAAAGQAQAAQNLGQGLSQQNLIGGEAEANAKLSIGNIRANEASTLGQIDFQAFKSGYGKALEQKSSGFAGVLGTLGPIMALAGAEMGGLGGLGLLAGGAFLKGGSETPGFF
jgi:hypothetical protein